MGICDNLGIEKNKIKEEEKRALKLLESVKRGQIERDKLPFEVV